MYGNTTDSNNAAIFDPKADFIKSENTYKFRNNAKDDNFWIERFNFYKPSSYVTDISSLPKDEEDKFKLKKEIFNHIVQLYDYLTGSSVSTVLYYTEEDKTLYMWKKYGETEKEYAARNIITDAIPVSGKDNSDISTVGIYYIDSNNNFDIYTEQTKNYIINGCGDYTKDEEPILKWEWVDTNTKEGDELKGTDTFVLNKDFYYYKEEITENGEKKHVRV
jgi:hypothetical protein